MSKPALRMPSTVARLQWHPCATRKCHAVLQASELLFVCADVLDEQQSSAGAQNAVQLA
jgi:hypothetical protein